MSSASHIPFQVSAPIKFPKAFDSVTCDSFKSATYDSVRFCYVRQLSGLLHPTAFFQLGSLLAGESAISLNQTLKGYDPFEE